MTMDDVNDIFPNAFVIDQSEVRYSVESMIIKDGAYYCYCAYVLCISRYSDLLLLVLINTGLFFRGSKLCGESRT